MRTAEAALERALKTTHELSVSNALAVAACPICFLSGRYAEGARYVGTLSDQVTRHGLVTWRPVALFYRGALACAQDVTLAKGVDDLQQAVAEFRAINHLARMPFYLGVLAEALAKRDQVDGAETTIRSALDIAHAQNEVWCLPELLRIQAFVLTAQ